MPSRRLLLLPLLTAALAGCGGDGDQSVKTYRVQKPADGGTASVPVLPPGHPPAGGGTAAAAPAETGGGSYRILGAMFPANDPQWFFKLTGKADELAAAEKEFDAFLTTVKFPNGFASPPAYDLVAGWTSAGKSGMRADTLKFGPGGKFEMSVIASVGGVDGNLARWAGQVGSDAEKSKSTREFATASGVKGLRVELTGPKNPGGGMGMMMPPGR